MPVPSSIANPRRSAWIQVGIGLVLMAGFWWMAWSGIGPLRYHTFFPLWLGYILLVDGITRWRIGTSLLQRLGRNAVWLFVISIPFWWAFEILNIRLDNWVYRLPHHYTWLAYHAEASLAFSTVVPAVFVTAELLRTVWTKNITLITLNPSMRERNLIGMAGFVMIALSLIWPHLFFPLVWIGTFFATDWLGYRIGARSISAQVASGHWTTVATLFMSTFWCGILWEMWNSGSTPSWTYRIAYADWFRIFEMPLLGFGGYLPFGLCLYAATMLVDRLVGDRIGSAVHFDQAR